MGLQDSIQFYAATDVGRVRDHNEDNYLVDRKLALFIVADGMGGHAAGEIASALAVRTIHEEIKKEKSLLDDFESGASGAARVSSKTVLNLLEYAVQRACARIYEEARKDSAKRGMGTTLSMLCVVGHTAFIAHVGDSRIYLYRNGECGQVTEDHTVINELIKRGKLTRDQIEKVAQKNAITRALGVYERVEVDTLSIELLPGDQFVLMSDGLHGYLRNDEELRDHLSELEGDVVTRSLIDFANSRGGKDNITTVLVRVGEGTETDEQRARQVQAKRDVLAGMPLFAKLNERELLRVMQVAHVRAFGDRHIIIHEGEKGDELFIVLAGKVQVTRGEAVLTTLGQGEHFGEMALIRAVPRSATVTSSGPADLIVIRRSDFFDILRTEHELAVKLLWQFLGVLADRLDQTSKDLRNAREVLAADDITAEIFPEMEIDLDDKGEEPTLPASVAPPAPVVAPPAPVVAPPAPVVAPPAPVVAPPAGGASVVEPGFEAMEEDDGRPTMPLIEPPPLKEEDPTN
jgi:PPM family protein phosphatase